MPPSEALQPNSSPGARRCHLEAKYLEGKYRRYHPLFGNQEELDKALCAAVTTTDLAETQALLGCGAGVNCFSGDPEAPTPLALAEQAGQTLQMEFLRNNRTTGKQPVGQSSSRDGASLLLGSGSLEGLRVGSGRLCIVL